MNILLKIPFTENQLGTFEREEEQHNIYQQKFYETHFIITTEKGLLIREA